MKKSNGFKNKLDEMQEQKLLKIEHNGYWLAFWGLLITMAVQLFIYEEGNFKYVAGEWIVFMCLCLHMIIGCMKNGIWDRWIEPTMKNNLIASAVAGVAVGIYVFSDRYKSYHLPGGAIATGIVYMLMTFGVVFAGLTISLLIYSKRNNKLENEEETDIEGEEINGARSNGSEKAHEK